MFEIAVVLPQAITRDVYHDILAQRGTRVGNVLNFEDAAFVYVDLCRGSSEGVSPDQALANGSLQYGDAGDIILIGSSKHSERARHLADLLAIATGGRVVDCE